MIYDTGESLYNEAEPQEYKFKVANKHNPAKSGFFLIFNEKGFMINTNKNEKLEIERRGIPLQILGKDLRIGDTIIKRKV